MMNDLSKGYYKLTIQEIEHPAVPYSPAEYEWKDIVHPNGGVSRIPVRLLKAEVQAKEAYVEKKEVPVYIEYTESELKQLELKQLRLKRKDLLAAFDKWEKAVLRGREDEDAKIMLWYRKLLDLDVNAFVSIPERIEYYL